MTRVRRLVVILLTLSALAGTAAAGTFVASDSDGTLSVRNADGTVWIKANGAVVGRFDTGTLRVVDPADGDPLDVTVWGRDSTRTVTDTTKIYGDTNVRFRIVGTFRIKIIGTGIDLSAVGQGRVGLLGDNGTYSFGGRVPRKDMPNDPDGILTLFDLGVSTGPGPGP
jgi:hypothetical protein